MATIREPLGEERRAWAAWVAERPENVRLVAEKFEPWRLYRLRSTGHRVTISSFGEQADGSVTVSVIVSAEFNAVLFERGVFGISPGDLEECDLPAAGEPLGTAMTQEEATAWIDGGPHG